MLGGVNFLVLKKHLCSLHRRFASLVHEADSGSPPHAFGHMAEGLMEAAPGA